MFYCETCRLNKSWPKSFMTSHGRCEICEQTAVCYDLPSRRLPLPPQEPSPHAKAYKILQDHLIPEEECNSVDFEAIYSRKTLDELLDEIEKRLAGR